MTRPYAVKTKKTKKRPRVEEEEEEKKQEVQIEEEEEETGRGDNDRGVDSPDAAEEPEADAAGEADQLDGIPISRPVVASKKPGVIFLLDRASLEVAKVGKNFQILNSDDHANFLKKQNRNPADYRPDIIHQSPNKGWEGLRALYVRTEKGVLFEHVRMPRTFKRFCGLMLQLLQKSSITAAGKREKLLNVIENDMGQYLPVNSRIIGLSQFREAGPNVGAMAHGKLSNDNTDDFISISNYPLSAACCSVRDPGWLF